MACNKIYRLVLPCISAAVFTTSCNWEAADNSGYFDSNLRGTWETNAPDDWYDGYNGSLVITRDTIMISGYTGYIGYASESTRPFAGITRDAALPGYAETTAEDYPDHMGLLYIKDAGVWQEGIEYSFYRGGSYPYQYFLRFYFGGRAETLRRVEE